MTTTNTKTTTKTKTDPIKFTLGAHHVGLTVPNVIETAAFFKDVLGYEKVAERPEYPAIFVSDGAFMITLWQASDPEKATAFDRKNAIGLHHLALRVENNATLHTLHHRLLEEPGVVIEFAPEPQGAGSNHHMICAIPGGIRVEFNAPN